MVGPSYFEPLHSHSTSDPRGVVITSPRAEGDVAQNITSNTSHPANESTTCAIISLETSALAPRPSSQTIVTNTGRVSRLPSDYCDYEVTLPRKSRHRISNFMSYN